MKRFGELTDVQARAEGAPSAARAGCCSRRSPSSSASPFLAGTFVLTDTIQDSRSTTCSPTCSTTPTRTCAPSIVIEGDFGAETVDCPTPSSPRSPPCRVGGGRRRAGLRPLGGRRGRVIGSTAPEVRGWKPTASARPGIEAGHAPGADEVVIDKLSADQDDFASATRTSPRAVRASTPSSASPPSATGTPPAEPTGRCSTCRPRRRSSSGKAGLVDSIVGRWRRLVRPTRSWPPIEQILQQAGDRHRGADRRTDHRGEPERREEGLSFFTLFLTLFVASRHVRRQLHHLQRVQHQRRPNVSKRTRSSASDRGQSSQVTRRSFVEALVSGSVARCRLRRRRHPGQADHSILSKRPGSARIDARWQIKPSGFMISIVVGVVSHVMLSQQRAGHPSGRVPPLAAMRDVRRRPWSSRASDHLGAVFLAIAVARYRLGITQDDGDGSAPVSSGCSSPCRARALVAAPIAASVKPVIGKHAAASPARSPGATGPQPQAHRVDRGALGVGLALLVGVSTLGSSAERAPVRDQSASSSLGDFAVSEPGDDGGFGGLPTSLARIDRRLPGRRPRASGRPV